MGLSSRPLDVAWALVCLAASVGALWTVVTFFGPAFADLVNSDAAVPPLLAAEMLRTHAWVPSSWYYVNDDIWVLGPQLDALPFVLAWGPGSRALAAGNLLGLAVSGVCVFLLCQRLVGNRAAALLVTLGVLAPFSQIQVDMVYVQLAYGWIFGYLCLLLFLVLCILECTASSIHEMLSRPLLWVYAVLVLLLFAGNMARGLVYWMVPVLGVCLLEAHAGRARARSLAVALATVVAAALGCVLHFALRAGLHVQAWDALFRTKSGLVTKLRVACEGLPLLVGAPPALGSGWLSPEGSLAALRVACYGLAAIVLVLVWRRASTLPAGMRVGARVASLLFASVTVAFLVSRMVSSPLAIRYLLPPALLGLLTLLSAFGQRLGPRSATFLGVTAVFATAFVGGGVFRTSGPRLVPPCAGESRLCASLAMARSNGLRSGFATYWNANALTLASEGHVGVCPISPDPPLKPERWLASSACLAPERYRDGFLVLLSATEKQGPTAAGVVATLGEPSRRESAGTFEVWTYGASETRDWGWLSRR